MDDTSGFAAVVRGDLVTVSGELDLYAVPALEDSIRRAAASWQLDLSGVTFMDSSGIHAIIRLCDTDFTQLVRVSPAVRRLFVIVGLGGALPDE